MDNDYKVDFIYGETDFWNKFDPNVRSMLESLERAETWTFHDYDFPDFFKVMENILEKVTPLNSDDSSNDIMDIVDDLIMSLSVMPFRRCVYSLSWLESFSDHDYGWGLKIREQSEYNFNTFYPGSELYNSSNVIKERINILIKLKTIQQVFSIKVK